MSFDFAPARGDPFFTAAGGIAALGEIADAARDQGLFVGNVNASEEALERAYDLRIDEIRQATGVTLQNPIRAGASEFQYSMGLDTGLPITRDQRRAERAGREAGFSIGMRELASQFPGVAERIGVDRPVTDDAERIAREAHEQFATTFASRPGPGRWLAAFYGGGIAALRDPIQAPLMLVGGGQWGLARSGVARIVQMGSREAVIAAATEALTQPQIQEWREKAGLPSGFSEATRDVVAAGLFGAVLGAGGQGLAEGARRVFNRSPLREVDAAARRSIDDAIASGFAGRMAIGDRALRMMDEDIAAGVMATVKKARDRRRLDLEASTEADYFGPGNPVRVERIVREFLTAAEPAPPKPPGLIEFLIDKGGVRDFQGELRSLGLDKVSIRFRGKLVKPKGMTLDAAREAAAEAGYLGHPHQAMSSTSVADLLSALDDDHRGVPVHAIGDEEMLAAANAADAARLENERIIATVEKIEAAADKRLPDDAIARAARFALEQDLDPIDALERSILDDARAMPEAPLPVGEQFSEMPFFDDRPRADDAERLLADDQAELDDLELPIGTMTDGEGNAQLTTMRLADALTEARRGNELAALVQACRT